MTHSIKVRRCMLYEDNSFLGSRINLFGTNINAARNSSVMDITGKDEFCPLLEGDIQSFFARKEGLYFTLKSSDINFSAVEGVPAYFVINEDDNIERFAKLVNLPVEELEAYILKCSLE